MNLERAQLGIVDLGLRSDGSWGWNPRCLEQLEASQESFPPRVVSGLTQMQSSHLGWFGLLHGIVPQGSQTAYSRATLWVFQQARGVWSLLLTAYPRKSHSVLVETDSLLNGRSVAVCCQNRLQRWGALLWPSLRSPVCYGRSFLCSYNLLFMFFICTS